MQDQTAATPKSLQRLLIDTAGGVVVGAALVVCATNASRLQAQAPAPDAKPLAFEVASVKPSTPDSRRGAIDYMPGGRFGATMTVRTLIRQAYGRYQGFDLTGGASWIDTDRYDITAKAEGPATASQINEMLQTLLADRFKLVVHHESRQLDIFALRLARSDGRLGPQMRKVETDCAALAAARVRGEAPPITAGSDGPTVPTRPGEPQRLAVFRPVCGIRNVPGTIMAGSATVTDFARVLATWVGRIAVDRTDLTGRFDIDLQWVPERTARSPDALSAEPNGPSIFTAIQEQLGLKLESTKDAVDVLVIDSVERPTED